MSTRIDVTLAIVAYAPSGMAGLGSLRVPACSITGTGPVLVSTQIAAAGASTNIFERGGLAAPVAFGAVPDQPGTFSFLYDTDASSAPSWVHLPAVAGFPCMVPGGGFSNASAAAQAGDNAGVPTGLTDAGRVDATIRRVLFTPASSVTASTSVQVGVFG